MSNKKSLLTAFNNHFLEFVNDIACVFPKNKDIKLSKNVVTTLNIANPRLIIRIWKEYVSDPYSKKIEEEDISFFIEKDYSNDVTYIESNGYIKKSIDRLREPIRKMGKENQDKSMKYMKNLSKLANLYFSM
jgi:hypothetical protein